MAEYNKLMPMLGDYYQVTTNWAAARTAWWNMLQEVGTGADIAATVAKWAAQANTPAN
jgi:multiple sugar transport system substrate-binding protein